MNLTTSDNILVTKLDRMVTNGGDVLHGIKNTDPGYAGFGEAYHSQVRAGAVKAWKRHAKMTMNLVVPYGQVEFVFSTDCEKYRVEEIGENRYVRLTVPPGIWFGFKGLSSPISLILNIANIPHQQKEVERRSVESLDYCWN